MSLTTPYREQFLVADGITTTFPFDDHGDGFDAISKNYVKCEVYNADGSVIVPDFTVDLSAKTITITSLTTPDGQVLNAPQNGAIVRIYRDVPETQNTTAQALQASTAQQIVQNFDNIVAMIQELQYANEHFTLRSTLPQRDLQIDLLRDIDDQKLVYWDNEKRKLVVTNYRQNELLLPADKGDILEQANAYSDEQNTQLENRINGKLTAIDSQIDANADAIQKTREDYIQADSEIHQILNNHADELTTLRGNQASLGDQVSGIEEKIPGSASSANPLATKQDLANVKVDLTGYATETYVNTREQKIRDDVNQADSGLQTQIAAQAVKIEEKQDKLTAGDNIIIKDNVISATGAGGGTGFDAIVVQELPATGQKGIIYLVPKDGTAPDIYDEYVWITATQTFELIGTTQVDLTNYATKNELNAKQDKLTAAGTSSLPVYYDGTRLKETTRLRAEMVSGGLDGEIYYAHHPEMNNMHILPFIYNDFAFIDKKGGSYTVTRSDNGEITRPEFIFDAAPSYMLSRGFSSDTVWTVEISTPTNFTYSTLLYVDFGTPGFACKYIKVEAQHSVTGEWKTVLEKTDNALSYVYCKCASDDVGVNKFRFTFKNPLSSVQFRISSIGAISFKSSGIEETVLTLKGGTVFGDVIAPNITKIQNETTSIKGTLDGKVNIAQGAENAGKILKVDDSGNVVVGEGGGSSLPDQAGNEGKVLTTNGTDAEWADMPGLIIRRL